MIDYYSSFMTWNSQKWFVEELGGGGPVAKFLLEWLKCGMISLKEMLDGSD